MGLEIALGVASLAVNVISGVNQMNSANKLAAAGKQAAEVSAKSALAAKEANNIQSAQQRVVALEDRRQRVRENRLRRAAMISASENTGVSGSSGVSGGVSALGSNFGNLLSMQFGSSRANEGINLNNQNSIDLDTEARTISAFARADASKADAFSSFLSIFSKGFSSLGTIFDQPD